MSQKTITITFGEQSENHNGMKIYGSGLAENGFNLEDLNIAKSKFEEIGCVCNLTNLKELLDEEDRCKAEDCWILVVKKGVDGILSGIEKSSEDMYRELDGLEVDKKYFDKRRSKVLNKLARHNLCFGEESKEPNYENGEGRVVGYSEVELLSSIRDSLGNFLGEKATNLEAEGNFYYDIRKCGIGFHGDSERKRVVALRLGESMKLEYQWFLWGKPKGSRGKFTLDNGDFYVMSEKASGWDWKKRKFLTIRHAAGCEKYLKTKSS